MIYGGVGSVSKKRREKEARREKQEARSEKRRRELGKTASKGEDIEMRNSGWGRAVEQRIEFGGGEA